MSDETPPADAPGTPPVDAPGASAIDAPDAPAESSGDAERPSFTKRPDPSEESTTRHERQEAKRQAREAEHAARDAAKDEVRQKKSLRLWVIGGLVLAVIGFFVFRLVVSYEPPYTRSFIHWHATVDLDLCGEKYGPRQAQQLPCLKETAGTVHGEGFCGLPSFHHHDDSVIHLEGTFQKREDTAVGLFFDAIGMPFSETRIWDRENGMSCEGSEEPGRVRFYVNGRENPEWQGYAPRDGDAIKVSFG